MAYKTDSIATINVSIDTNAIERWLAGWCVTNSVTTDDQFNAAVMAMTDAQAVAQFRIFMKKLCKVV